jgi:hypothetical protein
MISTIACEADCCLKGWDEKSVETIRATELLYSTLQPL